MNFKIFQTDFASGIGTTYVFVSQATVNSRHQIESVVLLVSETGKNVLFGTDYTFGADQLTEKQCSDLHLKFVEREIYECLYKQDSLDAISAIPSFKASLKAADELVLPYLKLSGKANTELKKIEEFTRNHDLAVAIHALNGYKMVSKGIEAFSQTLEDVH